MNGLDSKKLDFVVPIVVKNTCANTILVLIIAIGLCACDSTVSFYYNDYQDLVESKVIEKGWLPPILSEVVSEIYVNNDLDLNTSKGSFIIPSNSMGPFLDRLEPSSTNKNTYIFRMDKQKWVFTDLGGGKISYEMIIVRP